MKEKIAEWLAKCAAVYPDYATIDEPMLRAKVEVFAERLNGLSEEQVDKAFSYHIDNKPAFPTPADLIASLTPVKMYRFDNGPKGFNAMYPVEHPYVALQHRLNLERIDSYATTVCEADGVSIAALEAEARSLPSIPIDNTVELVQDNEDRRGGFQKLQYRM